MLYYIVNKSTGRVEICNGKEELISYIASYNCRIGKEKRNLLLENIAMNNNDKKLKYDFFYSKNVLIPRIYMVYDEFGRIVDPRIYQEKILNIKIDPLSRIRNSNPNIGFKSEFNETKASVEPIARFGNKSRHYYRHPRTTNEMRSNAIPEYETYIRGKRKVSHLPTAWDDYGIHTEKNWKRLKIRKQYMRNVK